ncbi:MAG: sulfatase-like hydrolase/transferase [Pelagibaca sp.]
MTSSIWRPFIAAAILYLVLIQPNHPDAMTWAALLAFPLEWPAILLGLMAFGAGRVGQVLRGALVAVLVLIAVLKAADFAMFSALSRGFNPVSDLALIEAGARLLTGAVGPVLAVLALVAAVVVICAVTALLWWSTGVWAAMGSRKLLFQGLTGGAAVLSAGVAAAEIGETLGRWNLPAHIPGSAFSARVGIERIEMIRSTLIDLREFSKAAANDPFVGIDGMLNAIDRDVIVVFVESYGRTSFDTPLFSDLHRNTLERGQEDLASRGLSMASGFLASPTRGGQSWLAHATLANGLWVNDQTRYGAALASNRKTLFHFAADAGFHTAAVMPQITLDWPESAVMGFETILAAADLGYEGLSFNWVTMPDQFTFAAMDRLLRTERADDRPFFIQVATGSSHAPWVPVPELVEWDSIGDGSIFDPMALAGEPPDVVWRDRDRVRAQYRLAIDYALQVVLSYAALHAENPPLMIVVGDHQAAGFIALDERSDVPIHVIGPDDLVDRAATNWGLTQGLIPPRDAPLVRMDQMRDLILQSFTDPVQDGRG